MLISNIGLSCGFLLLKSVVEHGSSISSKLKPHNGYRMAFSMSFRAKCNAAENELKNLFGRGLSNGTAQQQIELGCSIPDKGLEISVQSDKILPSRPLERQDQPYGPCAVDTTSLATAFTARIS